MQSKKVVLSTLVLMFLAGEAARVAGMAGAPEGQASAAEQAVTDYFSTLSAAAREWDSKIAIRRQADAAEAAQAAARAAQEAVERSAALEDARQWASLLEGKNLKGAGSDYLGSMPAAMLSYELLKRDLELIDLSGSGISEPVSVPAGVLEVNLSNNCLTGSEDEILPCLLSPKTYWAKRLGECFREETDFKEFLAELPEAPAEAALRMLDLSNCCLKRVPTLGSDVSLANLEDLDLRGNDFEDGARGLSALVARLPKLKRLYVEARYWKNLASTDPLWTDRLCSVITELEVSDAETSEGMALLLMRCGRLRSLTMRGKKHDFPDEQINPKARVTVMAMTLVLLGIQAMKKR